MFYIELFFERLFSEIYELSPVKILEPEIDIALARFNKLELVAEVKWKENIKKTKLKIWKRN